MMTSDGPMQAMDSGGDARDAKTELDAPPDTPEMDGSDSGGGCNNDTCSSALVLVSNMQQSCTTAGETDDYDFGNQTSNECVNDVGSTTFDGADVAFKIDVPSGQKLSVTVTPTSQWDPAIGIVTACGMSGASCVGAADGDGTGQPETASYTNKSNSTVPVYIIVDSTQGDEGPFDIVANLQ